MNVVKNYNRLSRFYSYLGEPFERKANFKGLNRLDIKPREKVLEIGFGIGKSLEEIAYKVGDKGRTYGLDISSGMLIETRKRLKKKNLLDRVELKEGNVLKMDYENNMFDKVFLSFTLELFDNKDRKKVLKEIKRVLKNNGSLGVVSLSLDKSIMVKTYSWFHRNFPYVVDCMPIEVKKEIKNSGYRISYEEKTSIMGLPVEIVIGKA